MNLDADKWVVGIDYTAAPTCSTCHMSATAKQPLTHDVGARLSWTLRPVISKKMENWEKNRAAHEGRLRQLPRRRRSSTPSTSPSTTRSISGTRNSRSRRRTS